MKDKTTQIWSRKKMIKAFLKKVAKLPYGSSVSNPRKP
jgi:hypothetical protein